MSVWHEFEGDIRLHQDNHVSIRKAFESIYLDGEEASIKVTKMNINRGNMITYEVSGSIEGSGLDAAERFEKFTSLLKSKDKTAHIDISVTIRWIK